MLGRSSVGLWVGMLVLAVAGSSVSAPPAHASGRTAKVLAGIAVGALVYSALDGGSSSKTYSQGYSGHRGYSPPAHQRYDPPRRYERQGYSERPRETYNRGYDNGWQDGYQYGHHQGQRQGEQQGYRYGYHEGYGDGRYDQRRADRYGQPYRRNVGYAEKTYGGCWH